MRMRRLLAPLVCAVWLAGPAAGAAPSAVDTAEVAVLARSVAKGELLSAADFATEARSTSSARGALAAGDAAGLEAGRNLAVGTIVRSGDLVRPRLVRRGEPVTISWRQAGLTITTSGRALGSGGTGDLVRVVASTNRTFDAVVEGAGAVRITAR